MTDVFQSSLPYDPNPRPLPGIQPLDLKDWILFDDAFSGQMALRADLIRTRRQDVLALHDSAAEAAQELLDLVLSLAYPDAGETALRPDGVRIAIDRDDPMGTLGQLVQEDLILLHKHGDEHVLTGAILCFPASWTLSEKYMRPLTTIHVPVDTYDDNIARRVQRLFDGVRPDRPLWRHNALWYDTSQLYLPKSEARHHAEPKRHSGRYFRSERQCILRLPRTGAAVFSVHTFLLKAENVTGWLDRSSDGQGRQTGRNDTI